MTKVALRIYDEEGKRLERTGWAVPLMEGESK